MAYEFTVSGRISKPVHEVFEAVADPGKLSGYFTTGGAKGRLETGAQVVWDFADFPGAFPVDVVEVEQDRKIVLRWEANEGEGKMEGVGYQTTVTMNFSPLEGGRTLVSIHETGWRDTPGGFKGCVGNCSGWTQMLCAMKVYVEHGLNLRRDMYV